MAGGDGGGSNGIAGVSTAGTLAVHSSFPDWHPARMTAAPKARNDLRMLPSPHVIQAKRLRIRRSTFKGQSLVEVGASRNTGGSSYPLKSPIRSSSGASSTLASLPSRLSVAPMARSSLSCVVSTSDATPGVSPGPWITLAMLTR